MTEPRLHLGDEPVLTDDEVREMLRAHLRSRYKTRRVAAAAWGVSRPFISQMLGGQRLVPERIAAEMGLKRVQVLGYVRSAGHG